MQLKLQNIFGKKENLYLIFALLSGLIMTFIMPPFEVPDENAHYYKAWEVAGGQIFCKEPGQGENFIPKGAQDLPDKFSLSKIADQKFEKFKFSKIEKDIAVKPDYSKIATIRTQFCGAAPFGYVASSIVLRIGEFFNLPQSVDFYAGRLTNLFIAIFFIYFAIKIVPFGKVIFMLIGLLPIVMQEIASFSYDGLHLSMTLFLIAYILKLRAEKNKLLSGKEILILFMISFVALNIKFGYFPLAALIFLLPDSRFKTRQNGIYFKLAFSALNALFFLLCYKLFQFATIWPEGVNVSGQITFVSHNPFAFLNAVVNSFVKYGYFYFESLIGIPGPFRSSFQPILYFFVIFGMFFIFKQEHEDGAAELSLIERALIISVAIIDLLLVFFVLYLIWTPVGADYVNGVQGRYLVVIFLLFILSLYGFDIKNKKILLFSYLVVLFISIFTFIFNLYY